MRWRVFTTSTRHPLWVVGASQVSGYRSIAVWRRRADP